MHKANKEKLGKKEEEYMILKMNKSNNLNSLIEEYQQNLNKIKYIGKFCMSFKKNILFYSIKAKSRRN